MSDDLELDSAFVAWGKAQVDMQFTYFKLYTRTLVDPKTGESGQFTVSCQRPLYLLEQSNDPVGQLKALARAYLRRALNSTGVPVDKWVIEFSPIMERYQVPSHLFLDTGRDRGWLL